MQEKNMGHICPIGRSWVNGAYREHTCTIALEVKCNRNNHMIHS